jgi:SNF5 / SMARCB1 / INI1
MPSSTIAASPPFELYPIRIDVGYPPPPSSSSSTETANASASYSIRILDTFLVDPRDILSSSPHHDTGILYQQWAHSIVTEALVVGMTRATIQKNEPVTFAGRVDAIVRTAPPQLLDTAKVQQYLVPHVRRQIQSQCRTIQLFHESWWRQGRCTAPGIPIRVRIELPQRIRIHDDFLYDLSCGHVVTPLQVAQSMVTDLRLPADAVALLTIHIMEQILWHITTTTEEEEGIGMPSSPLLPAPLAHAEGDDSPHDDGLRMGPAAVRADRRAVTAAWEISDAIQATNVRHLEAGAASRS